MIGQGHEAPVRGRPIPVIKKVEVLKPFTKPKKDPSNIVDSQGASTSSIQTNINPPMIVTGPMMNREELAKTLELADTEEDWDHPSRRRSGTEVMGASQVSGSKIPIIKENIMSERKVCYFSISNEEQERQRDRFDIKAYIDSKLVS